jgi:hypothetical protein
MMNKKSYLFTVLLGIFACQLTANAAISVNLGRTGATAPAESGFDDWKITDSSAGPFTTTIGGIDLTATNVGANVRAIDRGGNDTYNLALPNLTRTWWGIQAGATTDVQLLIQVDGIDLGAGSFEWTSWHVDHENQTGKMLVEYSVDGGTTYSTAATAFDIVDKTTDAYAGAPNSLTFSFASNGSDNIIVRYTKAATAVNTDQFLVVNGFEIAAVPEPATTAAFMGLLALGAILVRRRIRR